jgi:hypothetical protein
MKRLLRTLITLLITLITFVSAVVAQDKKDRIEIGVQLPPFSFARRLYRQSMLVACWSFKCVEGALRFLLRGDSTCQSMLVACWSFKCVASQLYLKVIVNLSLRLRRRM